MASNLLAMASNLRFFLLFMPESFGERLTLKQLN